MIPKEAPASYRKALEEATVLYLGRRAERSEVWRRSGVRGQVTHIMAKAERAFTQAMRGELPNRDHFIDLLNYSAFAVMLMDEAAEKGAAFDMSEDEVSARVLNGDWPWEG
jgi:hypothetical protein